MAYIDDDTSIQGGELVELYRFTAPSKVYRYTSFAGDVTTSGGEQFLREAIKRNARKSPVNDSSPELKVQLPLGNELVDDFALNISERKLDLVLLRQHGPNALASDQIVYWRGPVTNIKIKGRKAELTIPSILSELLKTEIPNAFYQQLCNHVLFDGRCKANSTGFVVSTTVASITSDVELVVGSVGGQPAETFKSGTIDITSNSDSRLITAQPGNTIRFNYPFKDINVGDNITLTAGCTHRRLGAGGCVDRYNNLENYGGDDFIPVVNIFETGLE